MMVFNYYSFFKLLSGTAFYVLLNRQQTLRHFYQVSDNISNTTLIAPLCKLRRYGE